MKKASGKRWTMYQADSLLAVGSVSAPCDAILTDVPYSSGGAFRGDTTKGIEKYIRDASKYEQFEGDTRDQRSFGIWVSLWIAIARAQMRSGATYGLFTDWRMMGAMIDAVQVGGLVFRGVAPWLKPASRPQQGRPIAASEFIVWGSNGPLPIDRDAPGLPGWVECLAPRDRLHPTEKPLKVCLYLADLCVRGGHILDPFCGSGKQGVAALQTGRTFTGIEMVPHYFELCCDSLSAAERGSTIHDARAGQAALPFATDGEDHGARSERPDEARQAGGLPENGGGDAPPSKAVLRG